MVIYSLWLSKVNASYVTDFVAAFREGGILYESLRRIPGHSHTNLLSETQHPPDYHRLLSISLFPSFEVLLRTKQSAQVRAIHQWPHQPAKRCIHLGAFSHLPNSAKEVLSAKTVAKPSMDSSPKEMPG